MTNKEKIANASNMMEVKQVFCQLFMDYCGKFARTHRKRDKLKETQHEWSKSMMDIYGEEMRNEKIDLFHAIPNKLHKSIMYANLKQELFL